MTQIPPPDLDPMALKVMEQYVSSFEAALPIMNELMSSLNWLRNNPIPNDANFNSWVQKAHNTTQLFSMGLNGYVEVAKKAMHYTLPG